MTNQPAIPSASPLWDDYSRFHDLAVATQDVDPAYPVLRHLLATCGTSETVEAIVLFVAYYDLGSGLAALEQLRKGTALADLPLTLPCATERRGHRDKAKLARHLHHLDTLAHQYGTLSYFLAADGLDAGHPAASWTRVRQRVEQVFGNGRWASYKTAELLQKVAGWPIQAPDMGMAGATGPAAGLRTLGLVGVAAPPELEAAGVTVAGALQATGHKDTDLATVETTLCDFNSLAAGHYYVGHDIDAMQYALDRTRSGLTRAAFTARAATLPHPYLGELGGWSGPDPARGRIYRDRGDIVERVSAH